MIIGIGHTLDHGPNDCFWSTPARESASEKTACMACRKEMQATLQDPGFYKVQGHRTAVCGALRCPKMA